MSCELAECLPVASVSNPRPVLELVKEEWPDARKNRKREDVGWRSLQLP